MLFVFNMNFVCFVGQGGTRSFGDENHVCDAGTDALQSAPPLLGKRPALDFPVDGLCRSSRSLISRCPRAAETCPFQCAHLGSSASVGCFSNMFFHESQTVN
jgi:hypothetical protein